MPYQSVTPERLRHFLFRLAREYRQPCRVYLVGGTSLLYAGLKAATKDVDLTAILSAPEHSAFTQALRRLRNELQMAIEEVSPADFIPMPKGTEERHRFLAREGEMEIFAFDPVATALSKLARYRQPDVVDIVALIEAGQLHVDTLLAAFDEILPRVEAGEALKITAEQYRRNLNDFLDLISPEGPEGALEDV